MSRLNAASARPRALRPACIVSMLAVAIATASAQAPVPPQALFGAGVSVGSTSIATSIPFYGADRSCGEWTTGSATPTGGSLLVRMPSLFGTHLGATLRLGAARQSAELVGSPIEPQRQLDPTTGLLSDITREMRLESSMSIVHLDALAGFSMGGFSIWAGPSFGMRLGVEQSVTDAIVGPSFARFRDGTRERDVPIAPELSDVLVSLGGVADLAYTVEIGPQLRLSPHIGVRLEPASPYRGFDWSQTTVGGGVDILFAPLTRPSSAPVVVAPPVPQTPAPVIAPEPAIAPAIEARLRALDSTMAVTDDPAEVTYREVIERRHIPLIPSVFFDSAASSLPARLVRYAADGKPADVAATLADVATMQAQASLLNVVGERLRANPTLQVTLVGSWSADEERSIGRARSEAVRRYLLDVWRLDPSQVALVDDRRGLRLSSEADADGRQENRRVELASASADLLRPIFVERTLEQAVEPVRLRLEAEANLPPQRWRVTLSDGTSALAEIDSIVSGARAITRIVALAPERITAQTNAIRASVSASFPSGTSASAEQSIALNWRREQTFIEGGTERGAERERTTWQVLGFGYNSSEPLDRHRDEVRTIGGLIGPTARVVITGYSDRLGDQKRNLELSRERAERVADALRGELRRLGREDVTIEVAGAGVDETRFSNDLPEGRFLSRGVTITVEQPSR